MNIFDILGPVMIGPSSSHTAGAVRAANVAAKLLAKPIMSAKITLYGSLAKTYYGHGTDCAVLGGLMGFSPDDYRITNSHRLARDAKIEYIIATSAQSMPHPNTVKIELTASDNSQMSIMVESVGGGAIKIVMIDNAEVSFTTEYHTTVIFNDDKSGVLSSITAVFANYCINIAFMKLFRLDKSAIIIIEADQPLPQVALECLKKLDYITSVISIEPQTN